MGIKSAGLEDNFVLEICGFANCLNKGRKPNHRSLEHLRDVERDGKDASKPVSRHFNLPNHSRRLMAVGGLSLCLGSSGSRKTIEQNLSSKSAPLIPTVSTSAFHSTNLFFFSHHHIPTICTQLTISLIALTKGQRVKPSYVYNPVDNSKLPCYTLPTTQPHSFFRNLPLYSSIFVRYCRVFSGSQGKTHSPLFSMLLETKI